MINTLKHRIGSAINRLSEKYTDRFYTLVDRENLPQETVFEQNFQVQHLKNHNYTVVDLPDPYWLSYFNESKESFLPFFHYEVTNARLIGQCRLTLDQHNSIHLENSVFQREFFERSNDVRLIPVQKFLSLENIRTPLVSLNNYFDKNYFHWITESLPRIIYLSKNYSGRFDILLSENPPQFQIDSIRLLLPNVKIHFSDNSVIDCEKLIVPSFIHKRSEKYWNINLYNDGVLQTISDEILSRVFTRNLKTNEIIFVSRKNTAKRPYLLEDELLEKLAHLPVKVIDPASITFLEQIKLYAAAKLIISPHGAGLTNTLFSQGSKVVELFPPDKYMRDATFYYQISRAAKHKHYLVNSENLDEIVRLIERLWKHSSMNGES